MLLSPVRLTTYDENKILPYVEEWWFIFSIEKNFLFDISLNVFPSSHPV